MNMLSLVEICAAGTYLYWGVSAIRTEAPSAARRCYFFISLVLAFWSVSLALLHSSALGVPGTLGLRMSAVGWALVPAMVLHFSLVMTRHDALARRWWIIPACYAPAAFFLFLGFGTGFPFAGFVNDGSGWTGMLRADSIWIWPYVGYSGLSGITAAILLGTASGRKSDQIECNRARLLALLTLAVFLLSLAIDLLPSLTMNLAATTFSPLLFIPWGAFTRNGSFRASRTAVTPSLAVEEILHHMKDMLILVDHDGTITDLNRRAVSLLGYKAKELVGRNLAQVLADESFMNDTFPRIRHSFHSEDIAAVFKTRNGKLLPLYISCSAINDCSGRLSAVVIIGHSRTENEEPASGTEVGNGVVKGIWSDEEKFRGLVEQSLMGIFFMQDDQCLYANPKMAEIFGYCQEEIMRGMPLLDLVAEPDRRTVAENLLVVLHGDVQRLQFSFRGRQKDGGIIDIETYLTNTEFCGQPAIIGSLQEVTERRLMEEAIRHQAYHDSLTSLPNRILFHDRLAVALSKARRDGKKLAVMFLDLDRFKAINDTLGHTVGDMLLQSVAGLLRGVLRESDTVARMGGDEYTILLSQIAHEEDAVKVAQKIISAVNQKWVLEGHKLHLTTSIGISVFPNDGDDAETLLRKADTAMYSSKAIGGNVYRLYHPAMDADSADQLRLENDLRLALENGELLIWYQPLIEINSRRLSGMEALIRWNHPERGMIFPKQFIPIAEKTGLIIPIGEWVLRSACQQARNWRQKGYPPIQVLVNISGVQLQQPDFVEIVEASLKQSMLPPTLLKLEITESVALHNLDAIIPKLTRLTRLGIDFSIDDFGMGYSSLNYLKRLPIRTIKIDRSFMRGISVSEEDSSIVTAIIAMAKSLNLNTVAEGVETEEQFQFLDRCHCDNIQGFLFSEPLPPAEFEKMMRN